MKKLIYSVTILSALLLAACSGDEAETKEVEVTETETANSANEDVQEEAQEESEVSESEIGKMTTIYQNKELNTPIESGTAKATLSKIRYATLEPSPDYKSMFNEEDIVTLITIEATAENTVDSNVNFYLDQATLVTDTGQQVDADIWLSDSVGGEFLGAVKKEGNIQWILKHDENIKKVTLHISGASDNDFNRLSEDLKVEIPFE